MRIEPGEESRLCALPVLPNEQFLIPKAQRLRMAAEADTRFGFRVSTVAVISRRSRRLLHAIAARRTGLLDSNLISVGAAAAGVGC
jgi:hypothetical protein